VVTRGGTSPNSDIHIQKVQGSWLDDMHRSGWLWGGLDERIEAQTIFQNKKKQALPHACNPSLGRLRQEDHEFKGSLDYIARLSQTNNKQKQVLGSTHLICTFQTECTDRA
jgi:hypothetical protein